MPDMRRLIGINARMLDQHLAIRGRGPIGGRLICERPIRGKRRSQLGAAYTDVDVPGARDLEFLETRNRADPGDDLLGNLARRLAKFLCKFKSDWQRILAKFDFRWLFDYYVRDFQVVSTTQKLAQMFNQSAFQISIQACPLTY